MATPATASYVVLPKGHELQTLLEPDSHRPFGQALQPAALCAAAADVFPPGHDLQEVCFAWSWYFAAAQALQTDPALPAGQSHWVAPVANAALVLPNGQLLHLAPYGEFVWTPYLYLPTMQPVLHAVLLLPAPAAVDLPLGQVAQNCCPPPSVYLPEAQDLHWFALVAFL